MKRTGRDELVGVVIYIYMHFAQTSKNVMSLFLSFIFFLLQNWGTGGCNRFFGVGWKVGAGVVGR
jgi:hypothetical protein